MTSVLSQFNFGQLAQHGQSIRFGSEGPQVQILHCPPINEDRMLGTILTGTVVAIGGIAAYFWFKPPSVTPLSTEWLAHTEYQQTKPGTDLYDNHSHE